MPFTQDTVFVVPLNPFSIRLTGIVASLAAIDDTGHI